MLSEERAEQSVPRRILSHHDEIVVANFIGMQLLISSFVLVSLTS